MKELTGAVIGGLIVSNVWLWLNLWNLKNEHFEFERAIFRFLKELCQQPAEDGSGKSSNKPADEV